MNEKTDLKSLSLKELQNLITSFGYPKFRASQLYKWIHEKFCEDFDDMTNIPADLRKFLKENTTLTCLKMVRRQVSKIDGTKKYLFELEDKQRIESVEMNYHHGLSVCISSQAGCEMGCTFCASTIGGLARNLSASEMLDQVYRISQISRHHVSNIVVMGSGEPLQNFENLVKFLRLINSEDGCNISMRNITVSTCGLVPEIYKFAALKLPVTLAISLHAPNDIIRKKLMPVANKYPILELIKACRDYFNTTGRRVTFEYALAAGINDSLEAADALSKLLMGLNCHVNLININPVVERGFKRSDESVILAFKNKLEKNRINVTIRRELGQDIDGACGQLRRRYP